ncbi:hypothetical protein QCA50_016727 [Cerrena zonata]|uniref:Alpha-galactosidase n=1 Tax=Cerrena zonata TaxID=2478898 RepID=A0AAW0FGR6_9APHY
MEKHRLRVNEAPELLPQAVSPKMRNTVTHSLAMFSAGAFTLFAWQNLWSLNFNLSSPPESASGLIPKVEVEGVARLPVLGYNTWNAYHCDINETIISETAQLMKSLGLFDVGYNYVNIDDCYSEKKRNATGDIVAHKTRFPSGMKTLTDGIHALGM